MKRVTLTVELTFDMPEAASIEELCIEFQHPGCDPNESTFVIFGRGGLRIPAIYVAHQTTASFLESVEQ